jgi:aromatic ring hydroxylase
MTAISPLTNDRVNRYVYVCRSREDLVAKAIAGTFTAERLGTCIYRCPGLDAFHTLASTTWDEEFLRFGSDVPTEDIMKVTKLLQNWTAGQHGVGTWHGAGPVMAQKIMIQRVVNYEHEKNLVKEALEVLKKK